MDFIPLGDPVFGLVVLGFFAICLLLLRWTPSEDAKQSLSRLWKFTFIGCGVGLAASMFLTVFIPLEAQNAAFRESAEATYGLKLSGDEVRALKYPVLGPRKDFEVYGDIAVDSPSEDGFERVNTFLIWNDGKLMLAGSPDGETFKELER